MYDIPLFKISQQQDDRRRAWCKKHGEEKHPNGVRDMSGAAFRYTILPTGCGDNIEIECIWCKDAKVILTEDDNGEFLYDLNNRKTYCSWYALSKEDRDSEAYLCKDATIHMQKCADKGTHMKEVDRDGDCKFCDHH